MRFPLEVGDFLASHNIKISYRVLVGWVSCVLQQAKKKTLKQKEPKRRGFFDSPKQIVTYILDFAKSNIM